MPLSSRIAANMRWRPPSVELILDPMMYIMWWSARSGYSMRHTVMLCLHAFCTLTLVGVPSSTHSDQVGALPSPLFNCD